jgi:hypothetical protein
MTTKYYAKRNLLEVLELVNKLPNGCWIFPYYPTINVLYNGKPTYIIKAIFDYFNKPYNGKIIRTCGNLNCLNPDHLISPTKEEKFWSNINIGSDEDCWEWKTLSGTSEYGETYFRGKDVRSHRLAWELTYGEIPDNLYVCHHCDNPPCCNPKHLFLGTFQDNIDDREAKGRNKMPSNLGEMHGNNKLNRNQVREIRRKYADGGHSYYSLADEYKVSSSHIRGIIKRWTWDWLKEA